MWITFDLPVDSLCITLFIAGFFKCYVITLHRDAWDYLWISQGIWSILEHLCYSITLRLFDTPDSLWITLGYLWINRGHWGR